MNLTCVYIDHWHDVLVGSILGLVTSYFSYRQFYPSLSSERSHRPFSPRVKREVEEHSVLPTHHQRPSREAMFQENRLSDAEDLEMLPPHGTKDSTRPLTDGDSG